MVFTPDDDWGYSLLNTQAMLEQDYREGQWARGWHWMRNKQRIALKQMEEGHLRNTIKLFGNAGYDISALEKELKRR